MAQANNQDLSNSQSGSRGRGFASMDPQRVSEIARQGGRAAHQKGTAHEWNSQEAAQAGRKGGQSNRGNNSFSQ